MITDRLVEWNGWNNDRKRLRRWEEKYESIYKDFFQGRNIVLSGHNVLTWWSDISHGISVLRIKQKLPMNIYCGANLNESGKVTFWTMVWYSASEGTLKTDALPAFSGDRTENTSLFLEDFLEKNNYTGWVSIDFLSEIPSGHGFASSSTISVLLTFLVYMVVGKLDPKILQSQELSFHSELRDEIYDFSLRLSNCISGGNSIGASNYAVMTENMPFPIVHFSQECDHRDTHGGNIMNDENTDVHIPIHHTLYKNSLANFFWGDIQESGELPIDYGVIFAGLPYRFSDIIAMRNQERAEKRWMASKMKENILRLHEINEQDRNTLQDFFQNYENDSLSSEIDGINMEILGGFEKLLDMQDVDYSVGKFIETLQKAGLLSFSYQKQNKLFLAFQYLFYQFRQFEDEEIGILPFNSGKIGGSLLFVMRKWKSQETLGKVLEKLKNDGYIASLDYASWIDGYASGGVQIEQFISEKIFSSYTKEWDVSFTDTFGRSYSGEYDTIIKRESNGILLDTIGWRIYIRWVKLTSKEIHSQNTTIDMFRILMENIGKEVSNSKLPVSTYSQNKNEILGKVVIPIKKLAQKHFWSELSLSCSGGITEYYLRLEKDDMIPIGIMKKLSH